VWLGWLSSAAGLCVVVGVRVCSWLFNACNRVCCSGCWGAAGPLSSSMHGATCVSTGAVWRYHSCRAMLPALVPGGVMHQPSHWSFPVSFPIPTCLGVSVPSWPHPSARGLFTHVFVLGLVQADATMERMRALLASYYDVEDDDEEKVEDSNDINSPSFDMVMGHHPDRSATALLFCTRWVSCIRRGGHLGAC
jgi:hypothetical protein